MTRFHLSIQRGISDADYVGVVLSPNSVESGWVEKEWQTKYWEEIQLKQVMVLPILLEDCEIPALLRPKKYADFRSVYAHGLVDLVGATGPILATSPSSPVEIRRETYTADVSNLLIEVQSKRGPIPEFVSKALAIALQARDQKLEKFWPDATR